MKSNSSTNLDFGLSNDELKTLMELRGNDSLNKFNEIGGINSIAKKLNTDIDNGINNNGEEILRRKTIYGQNYIPPKKPKTFWELALAACEDGTLIALIVCAMVSIVLAFVNFALEGDHAEPKQCLVKPPHGIKPDNILDEGGEEPWLIKYAEFIEGVIILLAIVIVIFVTAWNDYNKEKQFRGLQDQLSAEQTACVIRSGQSIEISIKELVVGDVCQVKYGDLLPADGMLIQSNDLKVDESSLTGESDHVKKGIERDPALLAGTHVMEGSGKMIVMAVGVSSQNGIIFMLLGAGDEEYTAPTANVNVDGKVSKGKIVPVNSNIEEKAIVDESTPLKTIDGKDMDDIDEAGKEEESRSILQLKLDSLTVYITYGGGLAAIFTFIALTIRLIIQVAMATPYTGDMENIASLINNDTEIYPFSMCYGDYISKILGFLIIGITVLVVAIPEGLPLAVTISLAYSVQKMMQDNNLVRHLESCETMGNATAICSDKTGTLTTNRMTVVQSFVAGKFYKECPPQSLPTLTHDVLMNSIAINTNYTSKVLPPTVEGGEPQQLGNKTECALIGFIAAMGGPDYEGLRRSTPEKEFVKVYTFNSARKSMTTIIENKQDPNMYRIYTKGASEIILKKCSSIMDGKGEKVKFVPDTRLTLQKKVIDAMAGDALRTIGLAYKDVPKTVDLENENEILKDLTLIAIVGIEDPVRAEVPAAIKRCQKAGITVRMVTGDNINTARSIAIKCGIIDSNESGDLVMEGKTFNKQIRDSAGNIKQNKLNEIWPKLKVLARSSPTDKYNLVKGIIDSKLKSEGLQVVAVTGDGTNDGPALKKADVGFAMGIAGTDVAKEASDIILTDDNFTSIVQAVKWGRNVYDSISKFLQFQLTVNAVAVVVACLGALFYKDSPLKAVQMLWVNLIMDTFASLALATEPPTEELLDRMPYPRNKPLVSRTMFKNIFGHAIYQLVLINLFLFYPQFLPCYKQCWGSSSERNETATWGVVPQNKYSFSGKEAASNPTEHFTMIFNVFVCLQIFNELNARKIHGERNIFKGIFNNWLFIFIIFLEIIMQVVIVQLAGILTSCAKLNLRQWIFCLALGFSELIVGQIINCIPNSLLVKLGGLCLKPKQPDEEEIELEPVYANNRGQILWFRGLNRIQQQIQLAKRYSIKPDEMSVSSLLRLRQSQLSLRHRGQDIRSSIMASNSHIPPLLDQAIDNESLKRKSRMSTMCQQAQSIIPETINEEKSKEENKVETISNVQPLTTELPVKIEKIIVNEELKKAEELEYEKIESVNEVV